MPLPIAQFKHANGAPLRPGDVLILQACADDFDDITPNKAPGVSEEVRLTIVDAGGFEQAVTREQKLVQDVLAEQRDKEHAAVQQITQAEKRIKDGENLTTPDLETLTQNEQVQREVRDRFGPNPDQLRGQLRRMEESLKQNGMQHSALRDRLRQVERELERLAENDLIQAEQQLASARQQAEKSALQADKARAAKRQADEMQERADKLNAEANDKEAAAGMPQNADKRDDLLAEAKKAREEEKRLEKEIEALKREAEKAEQEAGRLLDNTHTREAVTAARRRTEEVEKTLNDLLARLEPSRAIAEIKGEARDLLDLQRQLEARVEALERQPAFGKKPEEMTPQERDELKAVAEAQKELEDRTAALLERIRKEAELRKQTEPELAKKLQEAAKQAAKENVLGQMQEARTKLGANKLEEVRQSQKGSGAGLEALARNLGRQNEMEQEQLVKKLKEAEKQLEKIREEAEELRRKKQDLEEGKGNLTPEQRQEELKRLARREEELRKQTQELAKRLSREGRADRARQALEKAANNPDEMLERLNEAERELHRAEQREQEVLEREQLARILDVIERLRDRQAALERRGRARAVGSEARRQVDPAARFQPARIARGSERLEDGDGRHHSEGADQYAGLRPDGAALRRGDGPGGRARGKAGPGRQDEQDRRRELAGCRAGEAPEGSAASVRSRDRSRQIADGCATAAGRETAAHPRRCRATRTRKLAPAADRLAAAGPAEAAEVAPKGRQPPRPGVQERSPRPE